MKAIINKTFFSIYRNWTLGYVWLESIVVLWKVSISIKFITQSIRSIVMYLILLLSQQTGYFFLLKKTSKCIKARRSIYVTFSKIVVCSLNVSKLTYELQNLYYDKQIIHMLILLCYLFHRKTIKKTTR